MSTPSGTQTTKKPLDAVHMLAEEFELVHARKLPDIGLAEKTADECMRELRREIHDLPTPRSALCLSGGGIRSATFSLGVLQALAANGWLKRFNYLSTVSGGGYIGSWLSSWIARERNSPLGGIGTVINELSDSQARATSDARPVRRLRAYSNYLSPVWGISLDFITLITTFARNLFLNWVVLIPALLAILLIPRINVSLHSQVTLSGLWAWVVFALAGGLGILAIAYIGSDMPGTEQRRPRKSHFAMLCLAPMTLACVMLGWLWAWIPTDGFSWILCAKIGALIHLTGYGIGQWWRRRRPTKPRRAVTHPTALALFFVLFTGAVAGCLLLFAAAKLFPHELKRNYAALATFGMPLLLVCVWLGCNMYAALTRRFSSESDLEWWARASAWFLYVAGAWIIAHVLVVYLPSFILELYKANARLTVGSGGLLGIVAGIVGFWNKNGLGRLAEQAKGIGSKLGDKLAEVLSLVFIVGLLSGLALVTSAALERYVPQSWRPENADPILTYLSVFPAIPWGISSIVLIALLIIVWVASAVIGANAFSMQSMYGNRLVRAYLGATRSRRNPNLFTGFDYQDNIDMSDLKQRGGLFHVVNVALNMVMPSGDRLEWQQRKAAPFTISPLHCGSCHLGYQPSNRYAKGISLGRAMTLSGAAASPNMGYHTSSLVTMVLAFFNVRLGGWLPNPGKAGKGHWEQDDPNERGPGVINEALGRTTDRQPYVYLSDGGHFENLGLYEMVYRRCSDIVVVDGGCDPKYEYEDLENAIRKVRTDLGIAIEFDDPLPSPKVAKKRRRHFAVGTVRYKGVDGPTARDGRIIYIKPVLSGDESIDVARYASLHTKESDRFPQQSTADQFFDEAQFESYRELGRHSAMSLTTLLLALRSTVPAAMLPPESSLTPAATDADSGSKEGAEAPTTTPAPPPKILNAVTESIGVVETAARSVASLTSLSTISAVLVTSFVLHTSLVDQSSAGDRAGLPERLRLLVLDLDLTQPPPVNTQPPPTLPPDDSDVRAAGPERLALPLFAEAGNCPSPACRIGAIPERYVLRYLENLADALLGCASANKPVSVSVQGFASSSGFKGKNDAQSHAKNLDLANDRATFVGAVLNGQVQRFAKTAELPIAAIPVSVKVEEWRDPDKMRAARRYVDNEGGIYHTSRGRLNRRVDLLFEGLGTCAVPIASSLVLAKTGEIAENVLGPTAVASREL